MKKKLTAYQMWTKIGDSWQVAIDEKTYDNDYPQDIKCLSFGGCWGLCHSVEYFWENDLASERTISEGFLAINEIKRKYAPYVWPLNIVGAKARVRFCRRMAAKYKKKVKK